MNGGEKKFIPVLLSVNYVIKSISSSSSSAYQYGSIVHIHIAHVILDAATYVDHKALLPSHLFYDMPQNQMDKTNKNCERSH